jgi:alpha-N-arabinofuranosidase
VDIGGRAQPSFIGRRQQHLVASASAAMRYRPGRAGDRAGLVALQNERFYYFVGLTMKDDGRVVIEVEQHSARGGRDSVTVLASRPWTTAAGEPIILRIDARGGRYDFSYATRPNAWTTLVADADGTILSTRVAGGFVGTMIGMYAYTRPR